MVFERLDFLGEFRQERVDLGRGAPTVFVDFAHTPQAIESALAAIRAPRVIAVLGAGGDRDAEKRPEMGAAAVSGADVVIVTDDNPRSEDPAAIRGAVVRGALDAVAGAATGSRASRVEVVEQPGRLQAIERALRLAGPDDTVALLGKGHEHGQEVSGQVLEFDDVDVARARWAVVHRVVED